MKRLMLLVARDEDGRAVVVGAWEQSILEIIDQDEVDKVFRRAKNEWYPDGTEWREITLLVDEDHLLAAFDSPPVHGSVER